MVGMWSSSRGSNDALIDAVHAAAAALKSSDDPAPRNTAKGDQAAFCTAITRVCTSSPGPYRPGRARRRKNRPAAVRVDGLGARRPLPTAFGTRPGPSRLPCRRLPRQPHALRSGLDLMAHQPIPRIGQPGVRRPFGRLRMGPVAPVVTSIPVGSRRRAASLSSSDQSATSTTERSSGNGQPISRIPSSGRIPCPSSF